jgi:hypothetical protein
VHCRQLTKINFAGITVVRQFGGRRTQFECLALFFEAARKLFLDLNVTLIVEETTLENNYKKMFSQMQRESVMVPNNTFIY